MEAAAESLLDDGLERPRVLHPLDEADVRSNRDHLIGSQTSTRGKNNRKCRGMKVVLAHVLAADKSSAARRMAISGRNRKHGQ